MNTSIASLFLSTTLTFHLPSNLLSSLCFVESAHKPNAIHKDDGNSNSLGICQIKLATAKDLGFKGTEQELMNPKTNIHYAGKYLKHQIIRYKGSTIKAIIAYNRGNAGTLIKTKYSSKVINTWRAKNNETGRHSTSD